MAARTAAAERRSPSSERSAPAARQPASLRSATDPWGWKPLARTYCVAIAALADEGVPATQARIADHLGTSRGATSDAVHRLGLEGLAQPGPPVRLTPRGRSLAARALRRHRLVECFLVDVMFHSWAQAHRQAPRWAAALTPALEKQLDAALGHPTRCPHGNLLPGAHDDGPPTRRLSAVPPGGPFEVVRVPESLDATPGMLEYLERSRFLPGRHGVVLGVCPLGARTVDIEGHEFGLSAETAARLHVRAR